MAKKKVTTTTTTVTEVLDDSEESKDLFLGFALDESGSMLNLRDTMIESFNKTLSDQKKEVEKLGGKTVISLVKFNNEVVPVLVNMPISEVHPISKENYNPNNGTALFDGIMKMISLVEESKYSLPSKKMIVIMTDGEENSSKRYPLPYGRTQVASKITSLQESGWQFVFIGAEQNAFLTAQSLGIWAANTVSSTSGNVFYNMSHGVSASATSYRTEGAKGFAATMDTAYEKDPKYHSPLPLEDIDLTLSPGTAATTVTLP